MMKNLLMIIICLSSSLIYCSDQGQKDLFDGLHIKVNPVSGPPYVLDLLTDCSKQKDSQSCQHQSADSLPDFSWLCEGSSPKEQIAQEKSSQQQTLHAVAGTAVAQHGLPKVTSRLDDYLAQLDAEALSGQWGQQKAAQDFNPDNK